MCERPRGNDFTESKGYRISLGLSDPDREGFISVHLLQEQYIHAAPRIKKKTLNLHLNKHYLNPNSLNIRLLLRQSFLTLTHNSKKTFAPNNCSISMRAAVPMVFNLIPSFPIIIPFCPFLST